MIFRLSQKLNDKIKVGTLGAMPLDENPLADWSAHLFAVGRTQYILLTNTKTLRSIVLVAKGITSGADFVEGALGGIREVLEADGHPGVYEQVSPRTASIFYAKARNRSVTGSMNVMIKHASFWWPRWNGQTMPLVGKSSSQMAPQPYGAGGLIALIDAIAPNLRDDEQLAGLVRLASVTARASESVPDLVSAAVRAPASALEAEGSASQVTSRSGAFYRYSWTQLLHEDCSSRCKPFGKSACLAVMLSPSEYERLYSRWQLARHVSDEPTGSAPPFLRSRSRAKAPCSNDSVPVSRRVARSSVPRPCHNSRVGAWDLARMRARQPAGLALVLAAVFLGRGGIDCPWEPGLDRLCVFSTWFSPWFGGSAKEYAANRMPKTAEYPGCTKTRNQI
jgi:hypothetical protein